MCTIIWNLNSPGSQQRHAEVIEKVVFLKLSQVQDNHVEKSAKLMQFKKNKNYRTIWMSIQLSRMCMSFVVAEKDKEAKIRVERPLERFVEAC